MSKTIALLMLALLLARRMRAHRPRARHLPEPGRKTTLVGYLFLPRTPTGRVPAVVMMHGRAGPYSSLANGIYDANTLSKRHKAWGELWAAQGYVALLVDGFGPRGYPAGFPRHSYDSRPEELNEVTVRPLDAYGALAWLRTRADVDGARVGLQGWSNGGSATLAAMAAGSGLAPATLKGFAAALAFYPACGLKDAFAAGYRPYAPVHVFMGTADEEVSPKRCETSRRGEPAAGRRHRDHALSRCDARLRRSRREAAEGRGECRGDGGCHREGNAILCIEAQRLSINPLHATHGALTTSSNHNTDDSPNTDGGRTSTGAGP